jgi:hypothetical protein
MTTTTDGHATTINLKDDFTISNMRKQVESGRYIKRFQATIINEKEEEKKVEKVKIEEAVLINDQ